MKKPGVHLLEAEALWNQDGPLEKRLHRPPAHEVLESTREGALEPGSLESYREPSVPFYQGPSATAKGNSASLNSELTKKEFTLLPYKITGHCDAMCEIDKKTKSWSQIIKGL